MYIKEAIENILEKNLDEMKNNFSAALTEKAIMRLEEKKIKIAQEYFGKGKSPGTEGIEAAKDDEREREEYVKSGKKMPSRLTGKKK
jgi:regulator of replication initiation timing